MIYSRVGNTNEIDRKIMTKMSDIHVILINLAKINSMNIATNITISKFTCRCSNEEYPLVGRIDTEYLPLRT